jgi:hypothetical protein
MKICKKCNMEFPNMVNINGKLYGLYHRTFCLKCSPFKSHNTKDISKPVITEIDGIKYKICSVCKQNLELNEKNYYIKDRGDYHSQCKNCGREKTSQKNKELKRKCIEYSGGKCKLCGYDKYAGSLHFHHINPTEKDFQISKNKFVRRKVNYGRKV